MGSNRNTAFADFTRNMKLIGVAAVLMVISSLTYLGLCDALNTVTVLATTFGVFLSVLLGCGLFAMAFFSERSGFDQQVTDATLSERAHASIPTQRNIP